MLLKNVFIENHDEHVSNIEIELCEEANFLPIVFVHYFRVTYVGGVFAMVTGHVTISTDSLGTED